MYKIAVYAICKNEEKFVQRWCDSMKEADAIYVLDTGSNDNTVSLLKKNNVFVKTIKINPWRFDVARNLSLEMIPDDFDICVCTDLDEVFVPGWRSELEKMWNEKTNRIRYNYNWSLDKDNHPQVNFYIEKIHCRKLYKWTHPVHEVLFYEGENENVKTTDNITLNHYPDNNKNRSSYLPLLELSVKESPYDDRNMHYLGREYMYYGRWNEAIDTLIKHLKLKSATWKDERCASMRFISRCYKNLERYDEAYMWIDKAIIEAPYLRDAYMEKALLDYQLKDYQGIIRDVNLALKIKEHPKTYINEIFSWNHTPYDLLSIAYFYVGDYEKSYINVLKALEYNHNDKRLNENKKIISKFYYELKKS